MDLWDRIKAEFAELRQARTSAVVILLLGFFMGWIGATTFLSERMSFMEQRIEALQSPATVGVGSNVTWHLSQGLAIGLTVGIVLIVSLLVFLFWKRKVPAVEGANGPSIETLRHEALVQVDKWRAMVLQIHGLNRTGTGKGLRELIEEHPDYPSLRGRMSNEAKHIIEGTLQGKQVLAFFEPTVQSQSTYPVELRVLLDEIEKLEKGLP